MRQKVEEAINQIKPALQADGGDVEFVNVEEGVVKLKLKGACFGCPMAGMTLQYGIEQELKKQIPEVKKVVVV